MHALIKASFVSVSRIQFERVSDVGSLSKTNIVWTIVACRTGLFVQHYSFNHTDLVSKILFILGKLYLYFLCASSVLFIFLFYLLFFFCLIC